MYVGKKLKKLRLELDLNQSDMAKELGLSQSYYSGVELSKRKITNKMLEKINLKWGIDKEYFELSNSGSNVGGNSTKSNDNIASKMRGYNVGGRVGVKNGAKNGGIETLNEWQSRSIMGFEIEKTDDWITAHLKVQEQRNRVDFHYQRIVDVQILLDKTLKINVINKYADKEAKIMHSVFADGMNGIIRINYSTKDELLKFENELANLSKIFEKRFFELFRILYMGLRTDLKTKYKLPTEID